MPLIIWPAWAVVTALVCGLMALGITAQWGASRLTTFQKHLSRKLGRK